MYLIDDVYIPMIYEDIMNSSSGYINSMTNCGMYPATNYLSGTQIKSQPMQDAYETIDKKNNETENNFKSILKVLGLMILGGLIPPAFKYVKKSGTKLIKNIPQMFSNLWNKFKGTSKP